MELKICLKKLFRKPIKTLLFFILLTISATLLSICINLLMTAKETKEKANEAFTTIAIPNFDKIKHDAIDQSKDLNNLNQKDYVETVESMNKSYYKVLEQASKTKIGKVDIHNSYLAYTNNLTPVLARGEGVEAWHEWSLHYNMAVFELTCIGTEVIQYAEDLKIRKGAEDIHVIVFKIEKVHSLCQKYYVDDETMVVIYTTESEMEKRGLFEVGKKYLIAGNIKRILQNEVEKEFFSRMDYFGSSRLNGIVFDQNLNVINQNFEEYFTSYVEIKGDTEEFLNSKEGSKFKRLIENCQFYNQSVNVIGVNNINAISHFNQKKAYIIQGREITSEEYKQGQNVCIVSRDFAELNNLNIGDEIDLSLAKANYVYCITSNVKKTSLNIVASINIYNTPSSSVIGEAIWFLDADPFEMPKSKGHTYKIVGIYIPPKLEITEFMFSPNTIYVTAKSVDSSLIEQDSVEENFEQIPTSLFSIIVPNDKLGEFKEELNEMGIDKYFLYYDQGYYAVKTVLKILTQNALIILFVGIVIWILILIFFILLYIIKEKSIAGIMLSLGVGLRRTFLHFLLTCMLLSLPSIILGGVICNVLSDMVINISYNMAVDQVMNSQFDDTFSINVDASYNVLNAEKNENDKESNNTSILSSSSKGYIFIIGIFQFIFIVSLNAVFIYYMLRKNPMELVESNE